MSCKSTKRKSPELAILIARQNMLLKVLKFVDKALTVVRKEKHKLEIEKLQIGYSLDKLISEAYASKMTNKEEPKPIVPENDMDSVNMHDLDLQVPGCFDGQNNGCTPFMHQSDCFPQILSSFEYESEQPCNSYYFENMSENELNNSNPDNIINHSNIDLTDLMTEDELMFAL